MVESAISRMMVAALMFVVDLSSLIRDTGRQVDFEYMETLAGVNQYRRGGFKVKLAEAVDVGETGVTVDALEYGLKQGDTINFGYFQPVVVTVGAAGALADATSVPVDALTGPIPSGTTLYMGSKKYVTLTAAAAEGATSLTVAALPTAVVDNDTATFQGGVKELVLAADAEEGATALTVEAPLYGFADDDEGYAVANVGQRYNPKSILIDEGTVMVEVDPTTNRKIIPMALHPDTYSATGEAMVLLTKAKNDSRTDALTGYGVTFGGILYENLMPDAIKNGGTLISGWKTKLGVRYVWKKSRDSRGA